MTDPPIQLENTTDPLLGEVFDFSPEAPLESWRLTVPAKGACYVLLDADQQPLLLSTCADLRHALLQRLSPQNESPGPSKKIEYRAIVRHVLYRPVFSRFEAHWTYLENARRFWPKSYRKLTRHWRTHWFTLRPDDAHPHFDVTDRPTPDSSRCFGPFPEAATARRYTDTLEDVFDLCRYPNILAQSPHGQACAYKQMGRCPAPCDGTVPMESYRTQVRAALRFLAEPRGPWVQQMTLAMKQAAAQEAFELAASVKSRIEKAASLRTTRGGEPAPVDRLRFIGLFRGEGKASVRAFLITPGQITCLGQSPKKEKRAWLETVAQKAAEAQAAPVAPLDEAAADRVNLVAWYTLGTREDERLVTLQDARDPARLLAEALGILHHRDTEATEKTRN